MIFIVIILQLLIKLFFAKKSITDNQPYKTY